MCLACKTEIKQDCKKCGQKLTDWDKKHSLGYEKSVCNECSIRWIKIWFPDGKYKKEVKK